MTAPEFVDFYALLEIQPHASREEIERAFRRLARKYHPDLNPDPEAQERFRLLVQAREVLLDPKRRALYDRQWAQHHGVDVPQGRTVARPSPRKKQAPRRDTAPIQQASWLVETLYSRTGLVAGEERQRFYTLTRWHPPAVGQNAARAPHPLFICLVVDRSTSMQGPSLHLLRQVVYHLLQQVRPQDMISLIAFHDRAEVLVPPAQGQVEAVEAALARLQTQGATEFLPALETALSLLYHRPARFLPWVLFFTDGRAYDQERVLSWLPELLQSQALLDAFGLGTEWDENFLECLATATGGTVLYLKDFQEGAQQVSQRLLRLRKAYLARGQLRWSLPEGMRLSTVVRLAPDLAYYTKLGQEEVRLGPVLPGECWQLLWEWEVHRVLKRGEQVRFSLEIEAWTADGTRLSHQQMLERTALPREELVSVTPAQELVEAVRRLTWHRLQEKARGVLKQGRPRQAYRYLRALAHQLEQAGETQMARTVRKEMQVLRRRSSLSPEGEKRLKFDTQRLMLPAIIRQQS